MYDCSFQGLSKSYFLDFYAVFHNYLIIRLLVSLGHKKKKKKKKKKKNFGAEG